MSQDQQRTARLLFDAELADGTVAENRLASAAVRRATRVRRLPARPVRLVGQLRYKLGGLRFEQGVSAPLERARRAVLGEDAAARKPRFLVRVDEFPHYKAWDDPARFGTASFERFHEIMTGAGVPYLVAVLPRLSRDPLSPSATDSRPLRPDEVAMMQRLSAERISFGLHARDHRTRFASPRQHSELCGLDVEQTEALLEEALVELDRCGVARPRVFVAPYNRFDAHQLVALARRFQVVCGGPESIGLVGFQRTPQWRGEAVYLPSYAPAYGEAGEVLELTEREIERESGLWVPLVLHWGWEMRQGWSDLERLAERIAPYAAHWDEFLAAVARSREPSAGGPSA